MTQILVPGVAEVAMRGTISGHPFANVFHFKLDLAGQNWSITQLNSLCTALQTNAGSQLGPHVTPNVTWAETVAVDLGLANPATGISTGAPVSGSAVGTEVPPSTCMVVSFQTTSRYRGGHPRAYFPPGAANQLVATEDQWLTAFVGQYSTAVTNMFDAAFAAVPGMFQCAVRYNYSYVDDPTHHKYIKTRISVKETPQVFNWIGRAPIGTQRRRTKIGG